ncbi:baeRF3 domain-containing protein [Coleofasciculus sp.]|uniref:baeRF3 domain-containing protein n=1 Tax=Coleofasciculus sp. TaxID=3100458 RepID=UPI0039F81FD3
MPLLSTEELKTLVTQPEGLCVSIFMPTHTAGSQIKQDPIRFKNLMGKAEAQLVEQGMRSADAQEMLKSAQELDRDHFWRHQNQGLALFIAPNFFRYYRLPLDFEELVVVGEQFHLKPLMPLLTGDGRFYILALSQKKVRLLVGGRDRIREIQPEEVDNLPESLMSVLQYEDSENQTQFMSSQTYSPGGLPGSDPGTLHGRGVDEDHENQIVRFLSKVNKGIREFLQDETVPLVLAGVDYLLPIYKRVNSYPHLLEEGITGNPDLSKPEELHTQAWAIVQPTFQQAEKEAIDRFREFSGNNQEQASDALKEVVQAAYNRRIDSLFVALDHQQWGSFDPQSNTVQLHEQHQAGDQDLLDLAAVYTVLNGGTVFAVESERVPAQSPIAAVFRY